MADDFLQIQHFDVIDSTNSEAGRQIDAVLSQGVAVSKTSLKNLHKKIIVADSQTAGRGRMNRTFYSPKSTGVYMSFIWVLDGDDNPNTTNDTADSDTLPNVGVSEFNPALYTATAAVGVTRAIKSVYGIDTQIKWVNDVYLGKKKICGILAEGKINPATGKIAAIVVGIGVNIAMPKDDFPEDMKEKAGALFSDSCPKGDAVSAVEQVYGEENRKKLINEIAGNIFKIYDDKSLFPVVLQEYREKSNLIGRTVTVSPIINQAENNYEVEVLDVTENAELKVRLQNGEVRELSSGEVSLHFN